MQVRISRPVVIATAAGLRHLAPGLIVDVSDAEAAQIVRQKAGSVQGCEVSFASERKKTMRGKTARVADNQ